MKLLIKRTILALTVCIFSQQTSAQLAGVSGSLPTDYLTKEFHAGRRQAFREMMPPNSVAVIFSYPERVFSRDVDYTYHQNPNLYYFSGYKEPNAVLIIFRDMQGTGDSSYNEIFFVQKRDAAREQWTGKRLGIEGVKSKLGFAMVYNGEAFAGYPIDFKKFSAILYDVLPGDIYGQGPRGDLKDLIYSFRSKAAISDVDGALVSDLLWINDYATPRNLPRIMNILEPNLNLDAYKKSELIQELVNKPDSATLASVKSKIASAYSGIANFNQYMTRLRGIKAVEELALIKKSVEISSLAHAEVMRAINPAMSERELEGIFLYMHNKYGAENEGYPPIVGAGANGCILHYEENNVTEIKNQLVLMDVGSEYHGYSADVTRTVPANGHFTEEQKAVYQLVYDAQEEIFKLCREGVKFSNLNEKAKEVLAAGLIKLGIIKDAKDVDLYYPHGCSHHMGLDVHDKGERGELKENMVITVEPGIYIPAGSPCNKKWWDIGVRIEDDVIVGKEKCILLSAAAPRKWQDIEKTLADKSFFDQEIPVPLN
jgi:Xaa-Pro aminopeptidase